MATKSMLKTVDIKEKNLGRNLVEALEQTMMENKKRKSDVHISCEEVSRDKLKDLIG